MKVHWLSLVALAGTLLVIQGCASTSVKRMDVREVKDISGRWNDTDSLVVAEGMIKDCLARPWLARARRSKGGNPTVIIGTIRNRSNEHINTDTFIEDLQQALLNSQQVDFVADKDERVDMRREKLDQDLNASDKTRKEHGQEFGADFLLSGAVNTIQDREGGRSVMFYQVNLKLLDMQNNKIVWNGQKKIKKYVKRAKMSW